MLLIDANEPEEFDYLLGQMGIETARGSFNKTAGSDIVFPDFLVVTEQGTVGVNRKQAVEAMADLDRVEAQLRAELRCTERLIFAYEGTLTYTEEGTYAGDAEYLRVSSHMGRREQPYETLASRGRVLAQPHTRWTAFQWKLMDTGIPVVSVGNVRGAAAFLHYLHTHPDSQLFRRLIRTRTDILAEDPRHRRWLEFLTAIPGVGQEAAMAISREFPEAHDSTALTAFVLDGGRLANIRVASGRRIGPAVATSITKFLGIHALEVHP